MWEPTGHGVFAHEPCTAPGCGHRYDEHRYLHMGIWACDNRPCPCQAYSGPPAASDVCQNPHCVHLYTEHGTLGCRMVHCDCDLFFTQPPAKPDMDETCASTFCHHPRSRHDKISGHAVCLALGCPCHSFTPQPRKAHSMHPDENVAANPDVEPMQLYRVTLEVEIEVVSREGFGGASDLAMKRARHVFDNTNDTARVTGVKLQP